MKSKFYKVTCKCGHVGKQYFIRISFPINADSGKEASEIARSLPRVKHDHKDAILDCKEIDYEEYLILQKINSNDPYLKCENKQEQNAIVNLSLRLEPETKYIDRADKNKRSNVEYKLKKQKYIYDDLEEEIDLYEGGYLLNEQFAY